MAESVAIRTRDEIPAPDKWDLNSLFPTEQAWEEAFNELTQKIPEIEAFAGTLEQSPEQLGRCLDTLHQIEQLGERLGYYAMLRMSEDAGDGNNQARYGRFMQVESKAEAAASFVAPEIQAIPEAKMRQFPADPALSDYRIYLSKLLRFKPHILSPKEERLLALQEEANATARNAFGALTDVDMEFGSVDTPQGPKPLSHGTFGSLLERSERDVRRRAYQQFYAVFDAHKNTLANLYNGSVQLDIYRANVRNYPSARAAALFPDKVPESVYDNLVATVSANLEPLHEYYRLRKRVLKLEEFRHYDVRVPLVPEFTVHHTYNQAVDVITRALAPLGAEYTSALCDGLTGGWVDRYENKGKRSGAFSAGSYHGNPYILMNFQEDVLRDVFTLAHEGGHSMHSWYSVRNNPFQHYHYTIFEAEVASTFNEQLLLKHFRETTDDERMRVYLINKQVDDIVGTLYRQTMFAEFELITHQMVEAGSPLTVESLRAEYRTLLEKYFGEAAVFEPESDLEGLRVPHFYRAFYVYKYATGISASITLAKKVLEGGSAELDAYFGFLKSGGSKYPLESLAAAGVDMTGPEPIQTALDVFSDQVRQLGEALG